MGVDTRSLPPQLVGEYKPIAVYYREADTVEYVRHDIPTVHRRVDDFLTLVLDLETREPIGFTLKGFRNFYLRHYAPSLRNYAPSLRKTEGEFVKLARVLEQAVESLGRAVFDENHRSAYETARSIAERDEVELHELPEAA